MLYKKNILAILFVVLVGVWGTNIAIAANKWDKDVADTIPSDAENTENLKKAMEHAEMGLEAARAGDGATTFEHTQEAALIKKEIQSEQMGPLLNRGGAKIRVGGIKANKGDTEKGAKMIEDGIASWKKVTFGVNVQWDAQ